MSGVDLSFDEGAAVDRLMRFLAVEGVTGQEKAIGREVARALEEAGVPRRAIRHDSAHERIPLPTQTGNLIATLPGIRPGPRLLFMTHLDTVPLCAGAVPVRSGKDRITSQGETQRAIIEMVRGLPLTRDFCQPVSAEPTLRVALEKRSRTRWNNLRGL